MTTSIQVMLATTLAVPRTSTAAPGSSTAASVVFQLEVTCGANAAQATGFLVENWRGDDPALTSGPATLLVTSLHTLYQCDAIKVRPIVCRGDSTAIAPVAVLPKHTEVFVWPTRDLAAIPVAHLEAYGGGAPLKLLTSTRSLSSLHELDVHGPSILNPCEHNPGTFISLPSVDFHTIRLGITYPHAGHEGLRDRVAQFRGSLDRDADVLLYFSPANKGTSGGPVTAKDSREVLGIHTGGIGRDHVSWALVPLRLPPAQRAHLGQDDWPASYRPPSFPNTELSVLSEETTYQAHRLLRDGFAQAGCGLEYEPSGEVYSAPGFVCQVRISTLIRRLGSADDHALAFAVSLAYRTSSYNEAYFAPDGTELEQITRRSHGGRIGLHMELRLRQRSRWGAVVGLGVHAGSSHISAGDPSENIENPFAVGAPLDVALLAIPVGHRFTVGVRASLIGELGQNRRQTYTGNPTQLGPFRDQSMSFTLLGGLDVFAEY